MKQFHVLSRVLICLTFIFSVFSCEKEEEFVLMEDDSVFPDKQFQVPNLRDVQINFKSKTSVDKLFHNSSSIKSPTGEDFKFSVDWDNSHEAVYDSDRQLNILYTPLKYESSKRVKS